MHAKAKDINAVLKAFSLNAIDALNFAVHADNASIQNEQIQLLKAQALTQRIDQLEAVMVKGFKPIKCKLDHVFTPGLYTRKITMPAGSLITSKIHKTEHQWAILAGCCTVFVGFEKGVIYRAGDSGITYPGTRRRLLIHEETIWQTMHPTNKTTVEEVEEEIIEKYTNEYLAKMNLDYNILNKY